MSKLATLVETLNQYSHIAIAVSGGVDSMLLMYVANKYSSAQTLAMHACSPAVPQSAFSRLKSFARKHHWDLHCLDAGEMRDENYLSNPSNRCYFCKSNLFARVAKDLVKLSKKDANWVVASGTNLDDLDDYRPGLKAAQEFFVVQPYVEAKLTKDDIYALAKDLSLSELEHLPAQPCLASRIETGIAVNQDDLRFIDRVETHLKDALGESETVRCRITQKGVVLEFGILPAVPVLRKIELDVRKECKASDKHFFGVKNYQKGSAFLFTEAQ